MFLRSCLPRFLVLEASVNPMPMQGTALKSPAAGFICDAGRKYSGELAKSQHQRFQFIFQPNIQF